MAVYYNRFNYGHIYAGSRALNTSSNAVIAISAGPVLKPSLKSGLTLNNTASSSAAVAAEEGTVTAGG